MVVEAVQKEPHRRARPRTLMAVLYVLAAAASLLVFEAGGRVHQWLHPVQTTLYLQPDRTLGWRAVPGLRFVWEGPEYRVPVEINSWGFRDRERSLAKPAGRVRVAVLGDSFVEAVQVPLAQTAAQVLEQRLNAAGAPVTFEVLNLGVANFGVGQFLLTWESYGRRARPDVVFLLVAGFHYYRTTLRTEASAVSGTVAPLWVRPTFRLEGGKLVREPARDYARFVAAQAALFGGENPRTRRVTLAQPRPLELLATRARQMVYGYLRGGLALPSLRPEVLLVNERILEELAGDATPDRLVVVDFCRYFDATDRVCAARLEAWCQQRGVGYVSLSEDLISAERSGRATRWRTDGHFNAEGNRIFAAAMERWLVSRPSWPRLTIAQGRRLPGAPRTDPSMLDEATCEERPEYPLDHRP